MKSANWLLLVLCLQSFTASAQEDRLEIVSDAKSPLPMPLEGGSRWLRFALRTPQARQAAIATPTKQQDIDVTADVRAIQNAQRRIGSLGAGTFMDDGSAKEREQAFQRIWKEQAQEWRMAEAAQAQQTAGQLPNQHPLSPVLPSYEEQLDPTQAAIGQLRLSARNLDHAAADLEDVGKYVEADRLRASATRLRQEAREFASEQE